ncbi:peptide chain release factor N(5)-glutamine methyltransferase [Candidatus Peregrinibacteria bacterium]|nr:peptide chain release factor N(5)-glutamine methyltransferase [Candidatus Peregrinibacteria bacterium]
MKRQKSISEILKENRNISRLEARLLLSFVTGLSREKIVAHPEFKIKKSETRRFLSLCKKRALGVPLAYLTHNRWFYGLNFHVDERVLIPRPETELLVDEVIRSPIKSGMTKICDVGTGSGCIAIALAKNLQNVQIVALDNSFGALSVAKKNAKTHNVSNKIKFIKSDLLARVSDEKFDMIVANLPYIADGDDSVEEDVRKYEPKSALFSGKTGLELFEKMFAQIVSMPHPPKFLFAEFGFGQRRPLEKLIKKHFVNAKIKWLRDLSGKFRAFVLNFAV